MQQKTLAVISQDAHIEIKGKLSSLGYEVISLPRFSEISEPISSHPDMLMSVIDDSVFVHAEYYKKAKNAFSKIEAHGYKIVLCDEPIEQKYPNDVLFNSAVLGKIIFAKESAMSKDLKEYALQNGYKIVSVNQGYTKCTSLVIGEKALVSADRMICEKAEENNVESLLISVGGVTLSPYEHGFIGGASGYDKRSGTLFFAGEPKHHKDADKILDFCSLHAKKIVFLYEGPLLDIGTIFFM